MRDGAALVAMLLLIPLAVFVPWLVVFGAPVVLLGRAALRRLHGGPCRTT